MIVLSEKLQEYIRKVEGETGRQVLIQTANDLGLRGMLANFSEHPTLILVRVSPSIQGELLEHSVAHEVTHGLLAYGRNYCRLIPKSQLADIENKTIGLLGTMVEDIVVNKMLLDDGFQPFPAIYLQEIRRETNSATQGKNHYSEFSDSEFRNKFMVFRYIMAWGFLQYFRLNNSSRLPLVKFEKAFREAYPRQYKMANQVKDVIYKNSVFTSQGYRNVLEKVLILWQLENLVELKSQLD